MDETSAFITAVESFEGRQNPLSEELDRFISYIARTGDILAPWEKVQKVFVNKLHLVLDEFYEATPYRAGKVNANSTNDEFEEMKKRLTQLTEEFDDPPFTIQRLCELLTEPRKNYTKCDKFMRGIEKNLMVVSSWNNLPRRVSENNEMVNGMFTASNGYPPPNSNRFKPHWANLPPSPVSTTPPKIPGAPDFTAGLPDFPKLESLPENSEESKEEATDQKPDEVMETDTKQQESKVKTQPEGQTVQSEDAALKPSVSATIISSSPPSTINIKRKLDGSVIQVSQEEAAEEDVEDVSPTKKIKQDGEDAGISKETSPEKLDSNQTSTTNPNKTIQNVPQEGALGPKESKDPAISGSRETKNDPHQEQTKREDTDPVKSEASINDDSAENQGSTNTESSNPTYLAK